MDKSFHISHAALASCKAKAGCVIEVHVVVEKTDYIVCYLGTIDKHLLLQQSLDLNISEGEEIIFYIVSSGGHDDRETETTDDVAECDGVYLTGYFREDPEVPFNFEDLIDVDHSEEEEDYVEDEDSGENEGGENPGRSLWTALMAESLSDSDSDEDYTVPAVAEPSTRTRQGALPPIKGKPVIEEIVVSVFFFVTVTCIYMVVYFLYKEGGEPSNANESSGDHDKKKKGSRKRRRVDADQNDNKDATEEVAPKSTETETKPEAKKRKKHEKKKQSQATKLTENRTTTRAKATKQKQVSQLQYVYSSNFCLVLLCVSYYLGSFCSIIICNKWRHYCPRAETRFRQSCKEWQKGLQNAHL